MSAMSFAPPGESASDLWLERSNLDGGILGAVAYGVHLTLFLIVVPLLFKRWQKNREWVMLTFTTVMFIVGTIYIGANTKVNELAFIDNRNFPGGPNIYLLANYNVTPHIILNCMGAISLWMADALLIYRCLIIFNHRYWILLIPAPLYLANFVFGVMALVEVNLPLSNAWTALSRKFALTYFTLSLSLNAVLTLLITVRLLMYRHRARTQLGPNHGTPYTSIAAMLVESSALYSTVSLIFIVSYARNSPFQNLVLPILGQVQMISPLLIVLRVALGHGWSKSTGDRMANGGIHPRGPSGGISSTNRSYQSEYPMTFMDKAAVGPHEKMKTTTVPTSVFMSVKKEYSVGSI